MNVPVCDSKLEWQRNISIEWIYIKIKRQLQNEINWNRVLIIKLFKTNDSEKDK